MANTMHPLEIQMISILETGLEPSIAELGGVDVLASAAPIFGASPLMPELLPPLIQHWQQASSKDRDKLQVVLSNLLEAASIDFVLMEAVDILDANRPLPDQADEGCFSILLTKASCTEKGMTGLARGAALDGAFRWATSNRRWQLRLLDFLMGLTVDDDPEFLARAAKIMGVAYSHWRERDLLPVLKQFVNVEAANKEATFELGMANLADALDSPDSESAQILFHEAKGWFEKSASSSESRPEASLYLDCLEILTCYHAGVNHQYLADTRDRVYTHAFELKAWHADLYTPSWLGSRRI